MSDEYTFAMLKPDTLERGLEDEVLAYFEQAEDLQIPAMTKRQADQDLIEDHYDNVDDAVMDELHTYFGTAEGEGYEIVPIVVYGEDAVSRTRNLVGGKDFRPEKNEQGTIRGDTANNPESSVYADPDEWPNYYEDAARAADVPLYNMVHAAESPSDAEEEILLFFGEDLLDYLR